MKPSIPGTRRPGLPVEKADSVRTAAAGGEYVTTLGRLGCRTTDFGLAGSECPQGLSCKMRDISRLPSLYVRGECVPTVLTPSRPRTTGSV